MEKVFRLVQWLDMAQAVDYLQDLTATAVNDQLLLQLCEARRCNAYADVDGLQGMDWKTGLPSIALGFHPVRNPIDAFVNDWEQRTVRTDGFCAGDATEWLGELPQWRRGPIFKPAEIEALAAEMNGVQTEATTAVIENLHQQLERERTARRAAEERAEQAEAVAAELRFEIEGIYGAQEAAAREAAAEAHQKWVDNPSNFQSELTASGLTFPYSTKELEAMRAAVARYWENHTPDKRQPTQKAIGHTLGELLSLPPQGNGDPARKAIALASAIKPAGLPDV